MDTSKLQDNITATLVNLHQTEGKSAALILLRMAITNYVIEIENPKSEELHDPSPEFLHEISEAIQTPAYLHPNYTGQENFLGSCGTECPFCKSEDITSNPPEGDGSEITADVTCNTCHKEYTEFYRLAGFTEK
jgi:hypothetical protein